MGKFMMTMMNTDGDGLEKEPYRRDKGWIWRLAFVLLLGAAFFIYAVRVGGILNANKQSYVRAPQPSEKEELEIVRPELDDSLLLLGERVQRKIEWAMQMWSVELLAEDVLHIMAMPVIPYDAPIDLKLELFNPMGELVQTFDEGKEGKPEVAHGYRVPEDGVYSLWVSEKGFEHRGEYQLSVLPQRVLATYPQRLGFGSPVFGLSNKAGYDLWVFSADFDQTISLTLLPIGVNKDKRFQPVIEIYDPNGELVIKQVSEALDKATVVQDVRLALAGVYSVWISDEGADGAGEYVLAVSQKLSKNELVGR